MSKQVNLNVIGLSCASCVTKVEKALSNLNGVSSTKVNLVTGKATVDYNPAKIELEGMAKAVADTGYEIGKEEASFKITGMSVL